MSASKPFQSFAEFWPFYLREHQNPQTRLLHFFGTTAAVATFSAGVLLRKRALCALAPVFGYGPAWYSHFFIEKNRPATFKHPFYSLAADFVMWSKMLRGKLDLELAQILKDDDNAAARDDASAQPEPQPAQTQLDPSQLN